MPKLHLNQRPHLSRSQQRLYRNGIGHRHCLGKPEIIEQFAKGSERVFAGMDGVRGVRGLVGSGLEMKDY